VPDELAEKIEKARVTHANIDNFLVTLDSGQAKNLMNTSENASRWVVMV